MIYSSDNNTDWMTIETLKSFITSQSYLELQELNI